MVNQESDKKIPELDPELFTYDTYEMNFGDRLGLYHHMYADVFEFENFIKVLKPMVIGWCDPSRLAMRPKSEGIALMCEDDYGEKFWFHALEKTAEALGLELKAAKTWSFCYNSLVNHTYQGDNNEENHGFQQTKYEEDVCCGADGH